MNLLILVLMASGISGFMSGNIELTYINITEDLIDAIKDIMNKFNDSELKNSADKWTSYNKIEVIKKTQAEEIRFEVSTIKTEISSSRQGNITCNFHRTLEVNTNAFKYKEIQVTGNFAYRDKSSNEEGVFLLSFRNADISFRISVKNTSEPNFGYDIKMEYENLIPNFQAKDGRRRLSIEIRLSLGRELPQLLLPKIKHNIIQTIRIPMQQIRSMCRNPLQNFKSKYPEFYEEEKEIRHYVAIDQGWIDISELASRPQIVDVLIQGLSNIKSLHISYSDQMNGDVYLLRSENLTGNLLLVEYSNEIHEINFEIDFIIIKVKKFEKIEKISIEAGNFSVAPVTSEIPPLTASQTAQIKQEFESIAGIFLFEKISGDFTASVKKNSSNSTHFTLLNGTENTQLYSTENYNIGAPLARAIAKIFQRFHYDIMKNITIREYKKLKNQGRFSDSEMSASIYNIQEEMCEFKRNMTVKYDNVWMKLNGMFANNNTSIPFIVHINSLTALRQQNSTEHSAITDVNDKNIFLNSTTYKPDEKEKINKEILEFLHKEIEEMNIHTNMSLYDLCMDPETTFEITADQRYYCEHHTETCSYEIINKEVDSTYHIPIKVNRVTIKGLTNLASIKITKLYDSTTFQLKINELKINVDWCYFTGNLYLTRPQNLNFDAKSIELIGEIQENGMKMEFANHSRLLLTISGEATPLNKLITIERVKNKINETIISLIQHSIKEAYYEMKK